jgi:DNA-binding NtrC family response regulator
MTQRLWGRRTIFQNKLFYGADRGNSKARVQGGERMTDELLSLRAILLSAAQNDHEMFRQAASTARVPIEIVECKSVAAACQAVAAGADLVFIDGAIANVATTQVVAVARAQGKPPFLVLLAAPDTAVEPLTTDAVAAKPVRPEEARRLVERSMRVRLPSRVLVVDDSSTMRSIVRKILGATRFPFEVSEAAEGAAALKLAGENEFDIVFLDYNMPGFDGLEILAEFKRAKRRMTVVVMSSAPDASLVERMRLQGAAFLKKPFFPADIEAVLTRHYGLTALNPKRA